MNHTVLMADESIVKDTELRELRAKAKAHDAYMRATQRMRVIADLVPAHATEWGRGYNTALSEWAALVVEESRRDDRHNWREELRDLDRAQVNAEGYQP